MAFWYTSSTSSPALLYPNLSLACKSNATVQHCASSSCVPCRLSVCQMRPEHRTAPRRHAARAAGQELAMTRSVSAGFWTSDHTISTFILCGFAVMCDRKGICLVLCIDVQQKGIRLVLCSNVQPKGNACGAVQWSATEKGIRVVLCSGVQQKREYAWCCAVVCNRNGNTRGAVQWCATGTEIRVVLCRMSPTPGTCMRRPEACSQGSWSRTGWERCLPG